MRVRHCTRRQPGSRAAPQNAPVASHKDGPWGSRGHERQIGNPAACELDTADRLLRQPAPARSVAAVSVRADHELVVRVIRTGGDWPESTVAARVKTSDPSRPPLVTKTRGS